MGFIKVKCERYKKASRHGDPNITENISLLVNSTFVKAIVGSEIYFTEAMYDGNEIMINGIQYDKFEFIGFYLYK